MNFAMLAYAEPIYYIIAMQDKAQKEAMIEELKSIENNQTCELIKLPSGKKVIDVKWIFKLKPNLQGKIEKHEPRLMAKGFLQSEGYE